jgi:hypothetical protein
MTNDEATQLILDAGIIGGWTLYGDVLTLWEHDEDPPAPLKRPTETQE